ncbi:hypothetical protein L596_012965 [Steinernema carpocapsae]|uniref:Uncharacterized protein n=1 Tax=Steinernema carpocapsae TaxID=34508 RepID=A0A4U5NYU6_STECR|nr:hypothetical protein L596_012965 [Steinernema carpocapsae]
MARSFSNFRPVNSAVAGQKKKTADKNTPTNKRYNFVIQGSPKNLDQTETCLEIAARLVSFALFVSKTDRSFRASELEITPLRDFQTCLHPPV